MACIGYARVSTGDQTLHLQLDALRAAGCLDIYHDTASGATTARPDLAAALRTCRAGDSLVVWKLDRLGRNTKHLIDIADDLARRGIGLKTLTGFEIDTSTPHGRLMFQLFGALAEYERALIQERIRAGIKAAQARGKKCGRQPRLSAKHIAQARAMREGGISVTQIAQTLHCARQTVYNALAAAPPGQPQAEAAD